MFENLPLIHESDFQNFLGLNIRAFPKTYEEWSKMIAARRIESVQRGGDPKMVPIFASEYTVFCGQRGLAYNLKTLENLVDEKAARQH